MRYDAQTFLWDEFACDTVDAIRLVVYSDKRTLQPLDELLLALCKQYQFFFRLCGETLFQNLVCRRGVAVIALIAFLQLLHHRVIYTCCNSKLVFHNLPELLKFLVTITFFLHSDK